MPCSQDDTESYKKLAYLVATMGKCHDRRYFDKILDRSGDINYRVPADSFFKFRKPTKIGDTALHLALDKNQTAFKFLLDNGADFTLKNDQGLTVLHRAVRHIYRNYADDSWTQAHFPEQLSNEHAKNILTAHIETNNFCNPRDTKGFSHFHAACMMNYVEAVEFFLTNGVPIDHVVSKDSPIFAGYTPLHLAATCQCPETVDLLLRYGARTDVKDAKGKTPLHVLIERNMEVIDWMHARESSYHYFKHLHSCRDVKEAIVNIIIERSSRSDPQYVDEVGLSLLHVACTMKETTMAESHLRNGCDIDHYVKMDSPVWPGYTALHFAAHFNSETAKLLVTKGANIEAKDAYGTTPLYIFSERFKVDDVHAILSFHSVYKNIELSDGKTKLLDLILAMRTADQLDKFLEERRLDINTFIPCDSSLWPGYTILHLVVMFAETIKIANDYADGDSPNIEDRELMFFRRGAQRRQRTTRCGSQEYFQRLRICLNRGADITIKDSRGWTPLIYAHCLRKKAVKALLLEFHTNTINPTDEHNLSHLYIACCNRNESVVQKLLANGANVNIQISPANKRPQNENSFIRRYRSRETAGSTPLHTSVSYAGSVEITSILMKYGADVNVKNCHGLTPVHELLFCCGDRDKIVNLVLSSKDFKQSFVYGGLSHLHVACYLKSAGAVERLLDMGADINAAVPTNIQSADSDDDAYLPRLLEFITKQAGYTPLRLAKCFYAIPVVELLLQRGADIFIRDSAGWSPIFLCFKWRNVDRIDQLVLSALESDVVLQKRLVEDSGITMLHIACWKVDIEAVKLSLKEGTNVNAQTHPDLPIWPKYTPLHVLMTESTFRGIPSDEINAILQLLLENGADPILTNNESSTPIHLAEADSGKLDHSKDSYFTYEASPYVNLLLKSAKHLNVNPENIDGISHFHIACLSNDLEAIESFLQKGVDVNQAINLFSKKYPGRAPLHLALNDGPAISNMSRLDTVNLLLRYGANIHAEDSYWNTPLHYAAKCSPSRGDLMNKLIEATADINAENVFGETPFEILLKSNTATNAEVDFFLEHGCSTNSFNSVNNEGYIAQIFTYDFSYKKSSWSKPLFKKVMNDCDPSENDEIYRTVIHNIISTRKSWISDYADLIQNLSRRGCDIDHQDILGRTALYTAVEFNNRIAISGLLINGTDINILDNSEKTAFVRSFELFGHYHDMSHIGDHKSLVSTMATHVRKLQISGLYVHESNSRMLANLPREDCQVQDNEIEDFIREMEQANSFNITSSITLYDFLSETGSVAAYPNMMYTDRETVDKFFKSLNENLSSEKFKGLRSVLNLQYRKALQRQSLLDRAVTSLNCLLRFTLPEICSQAILRFFTNSELDTLILSNTCS